MLKKMGPGIAKVYRLLIHHAKKAYRIYSEQKASRTW
jgi:hypothetical protein